MGIIEIILISISLAMDAFAVSICKGLSIKKYNIKNSIIIATYFGVFQAIMPLIGYLVGSIFEEIVISIDHWISFILLTIIGSNMIKEILDTEPNKDEYNDKLDIKTMTLLAIATSIDALAVGITFSFMQVNIINTIILIGIITFGICLIGVKIGNKFGNKFEKQAQMAGGVVLIIIGMKILFEHLGIF